MSTNTNFNNGNQVKQVKTELTQDEALAEGKYFTPATDVYETASALILVLDMPGVTKERVNVRLENDRIEIEGKLDVGSLEKKDPLYSEYNVGHYIRRFSISNRVNRDGIHAKMDNGVLTLTLPKLNDAIPKKIAIQ